MPFIDLNPPSGSGVTPGDATITFSAICPSSLIVGDVVYISGDKSGSFFTVDKVDITTTTKMPAIGVIITKPTSTTATVMALGKIVGLYTGLTPNANLFPDSSGRLTETPVVSPSTGIRLVQHVARALSSDTLLIKIEDPPFVRVSG